MKREKRQALSMLAFLLVTTSMHANLLQILRNPRMVIGIAIAGYALYTEIRYVHAHENLDYARQLYERKKVKLYADEDEIWGKRPTEAEVAASARKVENLEKHVAECRRKAVVTRLVEVCSGSKHSTRVVRSKSW